MHRLRALLAASFLLCFVTTIATAQDQALQLGTPVERRIAAHETHNYVVTLTENQFAQLVVEQRGIDVVIHVTSPEGKNLGDFDSPNGDSGSENVSFVGITPGSYRISVAPLDQGEPVTGKYEIKLVEVREATEQEITRGKNLEIVKAKGLALLNEVEELIPEIHSPQTRIKAQLQAAQMLWDIDEKRSARYFSDAMNGAKEFIANLANVDPATLGSQDYSRDVSAVTQIRYEIISTLSGRDPEAALNFLHATKLPPLPYANPNERIDQDRSLELTIANQIITKDPKRTLDMARQLLKKGYPTNLVFTVRNLEQAHPDLAADLANEIATKLIGEKLLQARDAANLTVNLLSLCNLRQTKSRQGFGESVPGEPVMSEATCRELTQKAYQEAMAFKSPSLNSYSPERDAAAMLLMTLHSFGQNLDKLVDNGSTAVQKKVADLNGPTTPYQAAMQQLQTKFDSGQQDGLFESIQKMPDEMREQAYIQFANMLAGKGDIARAKQIVTDNVANPYQKGQMLANFQQQEMQQVLQRGKFDEVLKGVASLRTPRERANVLSQVARQIGPGQKRAVALNFLEQARSLLAPGMQAQDQDQMNALLELSRAFSRYDAKRAFEIVDPLIDQLNELCAAARTLEGFGPEYYNDEELDLQNGSNVANAAIQISNALGTLATTNFDRAKQTTDRLRLPEVRLHAYLEIAQQTIQATR